MKKKNLFSLVALATLSLGSCTNDEVVNDYSQDNAIQFGTYMGRDAQGRASIFETTDMAGKGFGVYAYYTEQTKWEDYSVPATPNFMNNTKVTSNDQGTTWTYEPLKYWPNTMGDMVSFFAYAPWSAGGENDLIKTSNSVIDFTVANTVTNQIDLTAVTDFQVDLHNDKRDLNKKVEFKFNHVLSRIEFTLQAAADQVAAGGDINDGTTITLNKIIIGEDGLLENGSKIFYETGKYSILENKWSEQAGTQSFTLTSDNFISGNNVLTETDNTQKTLIDKDGDDYIMIIPQNCTNLPVYVEYTVETIGQNAAGQWDNSKVENKVTSVISSINFEQGKAYKLNIVLGMNTVELSALVNGWDEDTTSTQVDLPLNVETTSSN